MGSVYGESNSGNGRSGSSKKGKKPASDKPKTPQRGLGVAQLEKIRLNNQMNCNYLPSPPPPSPYPTHFHQEPDMRMEAAYPMVPAVSAPSYAYASPPPATFGYHQPTAQPSVRVIWNSNNGMVGNQYAGQPSMTRLYPQGIPREGSAQRVRGEDVTGSGSQNPGSSEEPEIDLELRLGR
ncbi:hypothetical protein AQUCO_00100361v1 [Aquilegia coerulea]|uniref:SPOROCYTELESS-like EAR-containing protein 3 n=1 Tax=Aquilegia coerulea TaxID=218851 RepID=A0A2G5FA10_AQUCA|nr:hypothetical protein AQUCO_00100361v1 [Aquilegia coerulea]QBL95693.1 SPOROCYTELESS-like EAR-containing protein 3 [Aquilegia coerulea]